MDLIHQIYGTHCTRGTSALEQDKGVLADRVLGYSVRASSLEGDRLRECYRQIESLLYYYLPRDCPAEAKLQHTASSAPKRLVYVPSSDGWEILFQVCYRQTDTAGRPGSYFTHILTRDAAKQPGAWSVLDCLKLWEAPHWVTEDSPNIPLLLKPLRSLQEMLGDGGPSIDDGLMLSFLTTEANASFHDPHKVIPDRWCQKPVEERQQVFSALFSGLLGVFPHRYERALIAVEPGLAALLFYGILRLLPRRTLPKDLSFSTYEPKPDRKRFSLVATCFADPQETDQMRDWCNPADFVLNTYSGRGCLSQECVSPYAEFMADRLLHQGWEGVDELIRRLDDLPHDHLVDLDRLAESERANAALPVAVPPGPSPQSPAVPKPPPAVDDKIDPYHEWLGIPPRDQPPHYYRLLGITAFENNQKLIENAASNRIDRLRTFQIGQHSALSQRLINEVEAAKVCLLDLARKAAYDQQLRQQMQPGPGQRNSDSHPPRSRHNHPPPLSPPVPKEVREAVPVGDRANLPPVLLTLAKKPSSFKRFRETWGRPFWTYVSRYYRETCGLPVWGLCCGLIVLPFVSFLKPVLGISGILRLMGFVGAVSLLSAAMFVLRRCIAYGRSGEREVSPSARSWTAKVAFLGLMFLIPLTLLMIAECFCGPRGLLVALAPNFARIQDEKGIVRPEARNATEGHPDSMEHEPSTSRIDSVPKPIASTPQFTFEGKYTWKNNGALEFCPDGKINWLDGDNHQSTGKWVALPVEYTSQYKILWKKYHDKHHKGHYKESVDMIKQLPDESLVVTEDSGSTTETWKAVRIDGDDKTEKRKPVQTASVNLPIKPQEEPPGTIKPADDPKTPGVNFKELREAIEKALNGHSDETTVRRKILQEQQEADFLATHNGKPIELRVMVANVAPAMWYAKERPGCYDLLFGYGQNAGAELLINHLVVKLTADEAAAVRYGDWLVIRGTTQFAFCGPDEQLQTLGLICFWRAGRNFRNHLLYLVLEKPTYTVVPGKGDRSLNNKIKARVAELKVVEASEDAPANKPLKREVNPGPYFKK